METRKSKDWESIFRIAIDKSGMNLNQIATHSGVHRSQLLRFMNNERGLSITSAEKVARVIGLELKPKKAGRK